MAQIEPVAPFLALIDRITAAVERELVLIESIILQADSPEARSEAERRVRTLALLTRTLVELKQQRSEAQGPVIDGDRPRDLDELRRRLCERLERKLGGNTALPARGDVAGGDRLSQ